MAAVPPPAPAATAPFPPGPSQNTANPFGTPGADESFDFDLTNVQSNNFVGAGFYVAYLADITKGTSRNGNPQYVWDFCLLTDANGGATNFAGKIQKQWTTLTPEALFKLAETAEALGLGGAGKPMSFKKSDALGRLALVNIEEREFEGRKNSSVKQVYPFNGPGGIGTKYDANQMSVPQTGA
jgi:hypothetical protein